MAHVAFLCVGHAFVLQRRVIDQPVLPLAIAIFAHGHVERRIAAHCHAAVHIVHFFFGDAKVGRDFAQRFLVQVAIFKSLKIVFHAAQVEEKLLLRCGGADFDEAPTTQDELLH